MLKIWGRVNSVNVKKAMWCVAELGLPHERIDAGMQYGVVNTPEYRKMNPNGPGADHRRRRLRAVGVAHDRALPVREARRGQALADRPERARRRRALDGLGLHLPERDAQRVLGPDPHAAREARREGDRGRPQEEHASSPRSSSRRSRTGPMSPAQPSPWATSRSAARCSATCACRSSARRCRTSRPGSTRLLASARRSAKHVDLPLT